MYIEFANLPSSSTPLNATNLNNMQKNEIVTGTEYATNDWIDGDRVYKKRIDCGTLPNATSKNVSTGLTSANINIIKFEGSSKATNGTTIPLPHISPANLIYCVSVNLSSSGDIVIETGSDRSLYTTSYVDIYYTKIS